MRSQEFFLEKIESFNSQQVHLRFESTSSARKNLTLQLSAPVYSVTFRSSETQITAERLLPIVDMYKYTLTTYGHELLPEFEIPKTFDERADSLLLLMARQCPNLTSLTIRESISTSTLLLLAKTAINLCELNVRRRAVIPKMDWPENQSNKEFFEWLHMSSRSCEETEREIPKLLRCRWTMLSDETFQKLKINLPSYSL
jgi:F-box protein 39